MTLRSLPRLASVLAALLMLCMTLPQAVSAQDTSEPAPPPPHPRFTPVPKPTPDPSIPAATVNGQPIYRSLMKSIVADPVNRALIIMDFSRHDNALSSRAVDEAVQDYKQMQFKNNETKFEARLHELNASHDDYRQYVTEEVKLRAMLNAAARGSVSERAAERMQAGYIAGLRAHATINSPRN